MHDRRSFRRGAVLSLGLLALALAVGGTVAGAASAAEDAHLFGVLEAKDVKARSITISGVVYEVTTRTRMWDREGASIKLEDLSSFDIRQGLFPSTDATHVEIEATEVRGRWLLLSLRVVPQLPE